MKTILTVQNLKCGGCANTITNNISSIQNISEVAVDVAESKVAFTAANNIDAIKVKEKLKNLGYPSIDDTNTFTSKAKSFVSCATGKLTK